MLSKIVHTNHILKGITHGNRIYISIGDCYHTGYYMKRLTISPSMRHLTNPIEMSLPSKLGHTYFISMELV